MKFKISFGTPAQRLERLERIQKAGMLRFILTRSLWFGGIFTLFVSATSQWIQPWYRFVATVFVMSVGWAMAMWFVTLWQYRRAHKQS
jgi:hypothetical protein